MSHPFRNVKSRLKLDVRHSHLFVMNEKMHLQHSFMGSIQLLSLSVSFFSHSGINLSNETKFLPSRQYQRKFVYLNLAALKRRSFTHVILRVKQTRRMVSVKQLHSGRAHCVLPIEQCRLFTLMPLLTFENKMEMR